MEVKMTEFGNMGGILHCPKCDREGMHQMRVDVWQRTEDNPEGAHTFCVDRKVFIDNGMEHNPSPRRGGLSIHFYCDQCGTNSRMDIFQHKDNTFIKMEYQETYVCPKLEDYFGTVDLR